MPDAGPPAVAPTPAASNAPYVDDTPSTLSSVFDNVDVAPTISGTRTTPPMNQRPATMAHGNARALQASPATWQDATGVEGDSATRIEANPLLAAPQRPNTPGQAPAPQPAPPRTPTVQVGGASLGGKKKVVPLDDPRKR